jgi:hypothetical protein
MKVYPQYEISESHSKKPVDWVIKVENIIITVTEIKKRTSIKVLHRMQSNCRHLSSAILKNIAMIQQVYMKM